jgi:hypothetical protein
MSAVAIALSFAAVLYARNAATAAARSADAAESSDRRERTPQLAILLDNPAYAPVDRVIFRVRNDGPEDLSSVSTYRPRPPDRIKYPIAKSGVGSYAEDEIVYGPLTVTQELKFTLCCGAADAPPEFRVRITCNSGKDTWELNELLPPPRAHLNLEGTPALWNRETDAG